MVFISLPLCAPTRPPPFSCRRVARQFERWRKYESMVAASTDIVNHDLWVPLAYVQRGTGYRC